ncbi:sn-glycerol-3-phosphate ABC transporter ATP-binding protein UgpC [Agrobacterium tumefaciens]|uniref:ABC transporter ATP-binding protein n=1 Tax=Rhizobium/Agrobacterium group TaxID=227290 RepID=UPI000BCFB252|nr:MULTISPECIES: sn-glycerol-3-phosphate ABC transporter ATP-binding protein UgpC [Rhizobium/Agrobacterium group]NSZ64425.1 sn-glycerol-3-phosphate ABC transporter ATP-binding protein UgpC [Agrobacterium tumefaciens]NTA70795.1 sn-glycerol-3-phosphate ABC transporter ATP-binding protein UgpC [Agrobacterium tumefaciens]WIE40946.1 sn-glycerol-3-phosphate ABC transporter ATP-binding protein UgpC [Agrobacterium tumefaciens]SOC90766.1 carbohydrate ABC transporter ATP-binding protein, CUT1 family [Rhi
MASSITLEKIVKRFGAFPVVHGIDLKIEPGEFTVFVGPSGCGKSTLLRMIAGLEEISEGDLRIDGERVNETAASKRGIAMVFQSYALYPHMSVYKNLAFGLETAGYKKPEVEARVQKAADILQIGPLLQRKPKALSGGQRQRVAIGRAIVREPKIFLFDEPLSNLDAELRVQMRVEIAKLHQTLGSTMIYVTHDQVEAMTMADKIVVLRDGRIMQVGRPLDLYNNPANQFVAGFIGSPKMNFLSAKVASGDSSNRTIEVAGQRILLEKPVAAEDGEPLTFGIRPEHVNPQAQSASLGDASIQLVEHLGGSTVVYTSTPDGQPATLLLDGQRHIRIGETIPFAFDLAKTHLFGADGRRI